VDLDLLEQGEAVPGVDAGRFEQRRAERTVEPVVRVEVEPGDDAPDEAVAVAVRPGRRHRDEHVTGGDPVRAEDPVTLDDPDPEAREVELVVAEQPRVLGGLATDQRAARLRAALGDAPHERRDPVGVELADGHVVVEEQRLGAGHDEVVDHHRDEVLPHGVEDAELAGEVDLGAHAVGGADEDGFAVAGDVESEQAPEPPDAAEDLRTVGAPDGLRDEVDAAVGGLEIDARVRVGQRTAGGTVRGEVSVVGGSVGDRVGHRGPRQRRGGRTRILARAPRSWRPHAPASCPNLARRAPRDGTVRRCRAPRPRAATAPRA
jgi:hypothetical protein